MKNPNENNGALRITPVKNYSAPKYPTRADTGGNPTLLKNLPSRWQKNAKVIACVGMIGAIAFSKAACATPDPYQGHHGGAGGGGPFYVVYPTETESLNGENHLYPYVRTANDYGYDTFVRVHHGGEGAGPFYTVHLTEQEALSIIRAEAEAAGLRLGFEPPIRVRDTSEVEIDLFDARKGIAVSLVREGRNFSWSDWWWNQGEYMSVQNFAQLISEEFEQQGNINFAGVFYDAGYMVRADRDWWDHDDDWNGPNSEEKSEAASIVADELREQVRSFLDTLREQGVID